MFCWLPEIVKGRKLARLDRQSGQPVPGHSRRRHSESLAALRFPKSESSAEEARASLLEAFDRGIPYYSAGVSWLLDGMTQFADDPAVADKMKLVHRVALRLDVTQAFTVVRISDRIKR